MSNARDFARTVYDRIKALLPIISLFVTIYAAEILVFGEIYYLMANQLYQPYQQFEPINTTLSDQVKEVIQEIFKDSSRDDQQNLLISFSYMNKKPSLSNIALVKDGCNLDRLTSVDRYSIQIKGGCALWLQSYGVSKMFQNDTKDRLWSTYDYVPFYLRLKFSDVQGGYDIAISPVENDNVTTVHISPRVGLPQDQFPSWHDVISAMFAVKSRIVQAASGSASDPGGGEGPAGGDFIPQNLRADTSFELRQYSQVTKMREFFESNQTLQSRLRMIYFSSTVITTLGFGDIIPLSPMTRLTVLFEAFLGLLTFGVFISLLTRDRR